jgi:hypothetical protein
MDYPYRIPGTTGPDIVIRLGAFGATVLANGVPLRGRGSFRRTYAVPMPDGPARELQLNTWTGSPRVSVDGHEAPIGPQTSVLELVLSFLPIGLVVSGGLVGGMIGGVTVGVNLSIARGTRAMPIRVLSILGTTVASVAVWWAVVSVLRSLL